jgi:hypothetical protein
MRPGWREINASGAPVHGLLQMRLLTEPPECESLRGFRDLEHVPEKLIDFSAKNRLQLFDFEPLLALG